MDQNARVGREGEGGGVQATGNYRIAFFVAVVPMLIAAGIRRMGSSIRAGGELYRCAIRVNYHFGGWHRSAVVAGWEATAEISHESHGIARQMASIVTAGGPLSGCELLSLPGRPHRHQSNVQIELRSFVCLSPGIAATPSKSKLEPVRRGRFETHRQKLLSDGGPKRKGNCLNRRGVGVASGTKGSSINSIKLMSAHIRVRNRCRSIRKRPKESF